MASDANLEVWENEKLAKMSGWGEREVESTTPAKLGRNRDSTRLKPGGVFLNKSQRVVR